MIGFHAIEKTTVLLRIPPEAGSETKVQGKATGHEVGTDGEVRQGTDRTNGVFSRQVSLWAPSSLPQRSYIKHARGCPIRRAKIDLCTLFALTDSCSWLVLAAPNVPLPVSKKRNKLPVTVSCELK